MSTNIQIFFSYAHEDEEFLLELQKQLAILRRQGIISTLCDRDISAGIAWSPDSLCIASASNDKMVHVWKVL
jgi:WD40 repeat protein